MFFFFSMWTRALITKALRKKHFHKEAVKVELISPGEKVDFDKPWPSDLLKWDPLSSGAGDLLLEDLAKSFAAADKVSKNVKAIDFTSIIDIDGSRGFQLKDVMSGDKVVSKSQPSDYGKSAILFATSTSLTERHDLPESTLTSVREFPSKHQAFEDQNSQVLYHCETTKPVSSTVGIGVSTTIMEEDEGNNNLTQSHDKRLTELSSDTVLDSVPGVDSKEGDLPFPTIEEGSRIDVTAQEATSDDPMDGDSAGLDIKDWEKSLPLINNSESSTETEQLREHIDDLLVDDVSIKDSKHLSVANNGPQCVTTENQQHEKVFSVHSSPGILVFCVIVDIELCISRFKFNYRDKQFCLVSVFLCLLY